MDIKYKIYARVKDGYDYSFREVEGFAFKTRSVGLAIHSEKYKTWAVTHLASGLRIKSLFCNNRKAKEFLKALDGVFDWTLPAEELTKNKEYLSKKIEEISKGIVSL